MLNRRSFGGESKGPSMQIQYFNGLLNDRLILGNSEKEKTDDEGSSGNIPFATLNNFVSFLTYEGNNYHCLAESETRNKKSEYTDEQSKPYEACLAFC